jgi:DNA mismatch endonuclease (patch repair protein)
MRKIKDKNTSPEIAVRRLIRSLGFGYRLYDKYLPGKPDLVFKGRKKVIFIHGCFWHQHSGCNVSHIPKSNHTYWIPKLQKTKERDKKHRQELESLGWAVLLIWECELREMETLKERILYFLNA